jgi:cob(I)alamin adenosyltransferase
VRIYTGGGDKGETGLFGGGRVPKDHPRVAAYGELDELNAAIGLARAMGLPDDLDAFAGRVQGELLTLGADLATPASTRAREDRIVRLDAEALRAMEHEIDRCEAELTPLKTFLLPGGAPGGAALHLARTICRRAERLIVGLARDEPISEHVIPYVNRLSDLLFVMARLANARAGRPEASWRPA